MAATSWNSRMENADWPEELGIRLRSSITCNAIAVLESASLMVARGLDLFYSRLQPSKGFDMVPDDFPRALLVAMARIAVDENYCRIDWTTDATNEGAQRLYDRLGAPRHDKAFYRLSGDDLRRIAAQ